MQRIFISYRRDDAAFVAQSIFNKLVEQFGEANVIFDVKFPLGVDFPAEIDKSVSECDVLLAIIGDRWLNILAEDGPLKGQRRLEDPHDFVRLEIASALRRGIAVIPVLVGNVTMQDISPGLPPDLASLTNKNGCWIRSGLDIAKDLELLVSGVERALELPPLTPSDLALPHGVKAVLQGLRSFDKSDRRFFFHILPGPMVDGLPESIRFWKTRIEATAAEKSFRVGLIFGPSGCGKSSLVKAGLLPNLNNVTAVYVDATAIDTVDHLLAELRRSCPYLSGNSSLAATLRDKHQIPNGQKVLIVLDQFEQFLHSTPENAQNELSDALRECDGQRLLCLLMIRDDFMTPVTRFLDRLPIPLDAKQNSALVDLFMKRHAKKVLALFGKECGGLPASGVIDRDEDDFLNRAISDLAEGDRVICVRLALFAWMIKDKQWKSGTLLGDQGAKGVGVTFLENSFDAKNGLWKNRKECEAATWVLKSLLPVPGTTIKGAMRNKQYLLETSGFAGQLEDFAPILNVLDKTLRLVTPTNPPVELSKNRSAQMADGDKHYQLTHDYLVPSLREWLTRKLSETRRGRAEQCLDERAATWTAKPEIRNLPSLLEFGNIHWFTHKRNWTESQRIVMQRAAWVHFFRGTTVTALFAIVAVVGLWIRSTFVEQRHKDQAQSLVHRLVDADIGMVPSIVKEIESQRGYVDPLLSKEFQSAPDGSGRKLRTALAMVEEPACVYLRDQLVKVSIAEFPIVRDFFAADPHHHPVQFTEPLWSMAADGAELIDSRFRAACALATFDPHDDRWKELAPVMARHLVGLASSELVAWRVALRPARQQLREPLVAILRTNARGTQLRLVAAETLADYADDDANFLAELLLEADPETFEILLTAFKKNPANGLTRFHAELVKTLKPHWNDMPLDGDWKSLDPYLAERIRKADGLVDERWAMCLSLPIEELFELCGRLRPSGYRPISVAAWQRDSQMLAGVVWSRDGGKWELAGPVSTDEALQLDETHRKAGLTPQVVNRLPSEEQKMCVIWGQRAEPACIPIMQLDASVPPRLVPLPAPVKWSVKMFRFDPGDSRQPPTDSAGTVDGEPFSHSSLPDLEQLPYLEIDLAADQAEAQELHNLTFSAAKSFDLDAGEYHVWAAADDGVRVYFDGNLVVDRWTEKIRSSPIVTIPANSGKHEVRVVNYQLDGHWRLAVRLVPAAANSASQAAAVPGVGKYDLKKVNGVETAALVGEIVRRCAEGYRPFTMSAAAEPGQAQHIVVVCRRPAVKEDDKDALAQRQSHATVALARLGQPNEIWARLAITPDPRLRTELILDLAEHRVDVKTLLEHLDAETDVSIRRALLLALGKYPVKRMPAVRRQLLIRNSLREYAETADAGMHGALEWLLRTWGQSDDEEDIIERLKNQVERLKELEPALQMRRRTGDQRGWYVNSQLQTFVAFPADTFWMGSAEPPPGIFVNEFEHRRRIERPFAISSTEVTHDQYMKFVVATNARDPRNPVVQTGDSPQTGLEWEEAALYCNWLSEQEKIPRDQWCYELDANQENAPALKMKDNFLDLDGYRLPTEAEWEYACRAGTQTTWYFGQSAARLTEFCWYLDNCGDRVRPVGLKMPNDAGLFDMLGNAYEWCQDIFRKYPQGSQITPTLVDRSTTIVHPGDSRAMRGGSYRNILIDCRCAARNQDRPGHLTNAIGFRPARTFVLKVKPSQH